MTQFSRILDLPAELRYNIYHEALLPETLHVSLTGTKSAQNIECFDLTTGRITKSSLRDIWNSEDIDSRKISFQHIFESEDKLVIEPFSVSTFRVNRQIYAELQHLFYDKSTWFFNSLDSLVCGLIFLPRHVRTKIRRLAFTLMPFELESRWYYFPRVIPRTQDRQWYLHSISRLIQTNMRLQTLSIHYSKLGMLLDGVTARELRQSSEGHKAACAVTEFVWPGVVTSLLYSNAEMTRDLLGSVGKICGARNVEWRSHGQDRYCIPLAELVIRQPLESLAK